jgi:hypothetical protein
MSDDIRIESTIAGTDQLKTNPRGEAEGKTKKRTRRKPLATPKAEPADSAVKQDDAEGHDRLDIRV